MEEAGKEKKRNGDGKGKQGRSKVLERKGSGKWVRVGGRMKEREEEGRGKGSLRRGKDKG